VTINNDVTLSMNNDVTLSINNDVTLSINNDVTLSINNANNNVDNQFNFFQTATSSMYNNVPKEPPCSSGNYSRATTLPFNSKFSRCNTCLVWFGYDI